MACQCCILTGLTCARGDESHASAAFSLTTTVLTCTRGAGMQVGAAFSLTTVFSSMQHAMLCVCRCTSEHAVWKLQIQMLNQHLEACLLSSGRTLGALIMNWSGTVQSDVELNKAQCCC